MKTWIITLAFAAILACSGSVNAKTAKKSSHAVTGTITSVKATIFTMKVGGKTISVDAANAKVSRGKGIHKVKGVGGLHAGMHVKVVGSKHGNRITATKVTQAKTHRSSKTKKT